MKYLEETKRLLDKSNSFYIITSGMDGTYSYVNQHYANQFNYIHKEFVGQPYHITMHIDDRKICAEVSQKCFANPGLLFPAIIRKHDGNGGYIYTQWEYRAIFDEDENPTGILALGYNITEFIADKNRLEGAMDEIDKKSMLLTKIAFQQSHEIRAPLTNILALTGILEKRTKDEQLLPLCKMIMESALNLDNAVRSIVGNIYSSEEEKDDV